MTAPRPTGYRRRVADLETRIDACVEARRDDLVELVRQLVRFDTTSVDLSPGSDQTENEEEPLQALLAARLGALGAEVDRWEPDPASFAGHPMMPPWHHWRGRPITVGVLRGRGGGRALVINGHVDVVGQGTGALGERPVRGRDAGRQDLRARSLRHEGGIAAALVALEALGDAGIRLDGDVVFEAVTDEETCAMGTIAAIERGYRGDAGLFPSRPASTSGSRRAASCTARCRSRAARRTRR